MGLKICILSSRDARDVVKLEKAYRPHSAFFFFLADGGNLSQNSGKRGPSHSVQEIRHLTCTEPTHDRSPTP